LNNFVDPGIDWRVVISSYIGLILVISAPCSLWAWAFQPFSRTSSRILHHTRAVFLPLLHGRSARQFLARKAERFSITSAYQQLLPIHEYWHHHSWRYRVLPESDRRRACSPAPLQLKFGDGANGWKKEKPQRKYAFIGLIVALLACVSTGLIGAAKALISMGMFTLESTDPLNLALQISIGVLLLGLAAYAILSPDSVRRFFLDARHATVQIH
jgi:hypothetical protein